MWMGRDRGGKVEGQAVSDASRAIWSQPHAVSGRLTPQASSSSRAACDGSPHADPHLGRSSHSSERGVPELSRPASHSTLTKVRVSPNEPREESRHLQAPAHSPVTHPQG